MPAPALAANAVLTLNEAKRYLGIEEGDPSRDAEVTEAVNEASQVAEDFCGTCLRQKAFTSEQHDGSGDYDLWLDNAPVASISAITEETIAVVSTQYALYASRGKVRRTDGYWGSVVGSVLVSYVAGHAFYDSADYDPWLLPGDFTAWVSGTVYALGDRRTGKAAGAFTGYVFQATTAHTAADLTEPGVGANWATVWTQVNDYAVGALVTGKAAGAFTDHVWQCLVANTSAVASEPGVGASYATYWVQVADCGVGLIPAAVKAAVKELVGLILRSPETTGVKSEGEDGMSITYDPDALPATVRGKLAPYRLIRMGV